MQVSTERSSFQRAKPHTAAAVELRGVSKRYGSVEALHGVDLQINAGEVIALLGPNGAGKTTAVSLLVGLLNPTSGSVRIWGENPRAPASRQRIGAMLQRSGVPETLNVGELLELFSSYYSAPLALPALLAAAGLEGLHNRRFGKLSGGQQQRLMFALAVCGDPELLFLDEPTTGLDLELRLQFWSHIRSFIAGGRTVVLTTHQLEEADALADRIVVLDRGTIIASGTPAQIKQQVAGRHIRCVTRLAPEQVSHIGGVHSARRNGQALELVVGDAETVVTQLLALDPSLTDLEIGSVSLEDAFLALTRRTAATEEAA